ncbi:MAG: DUF2783 domain-containing protein [Bacteroidetes bacterium]|nr:MAG: DUF2783 domain-containing protein [Bacteroidota bacterium]
MQHITPSTYQNPEFPYARSADQDAPRPVRHRVVVVGAGPTGLVAALDLASQQIPCVVLCKNHTVSIGSRAICFSKRTLEIIDRVCPAAAKRMLEKGVTWNTGKVFYQERQVYTFNLLPEPGHKIPAFINLQQYYFEEYLIDAIQANPLIDLRWQHELTDVSQDAAGVYLNIQTPEGTYALEAEYLLACDGVHSRTREALSIPFAGERFEENFLIADIVMENEFPSERWFWFDPPFNPGNSALLHKQPDNVWRIDLQLGWDIDREKELDPDRIRDRIRRMLGPGVEFELEWTSIYQFRCMRIPNFVVQRVLFAGDSAHLVSPYGARGANGGIQDVDNLVWKLALVLKGEAPASLLHSYQEERSPAADENIRHSTQATDFITPKSEISRMFRNAALELAEIDEVVKKMINSGRLSNAFKYLNSTLTTSDLGDWAGSVQPGYPAKDVPLDRSGKTIWLSDLLGDRFVLACFDGPAGWPSGFDKLAGAPVLLDIRPAGADLEEACTDRDGLFAERYGALPGNWYLFRPDGHLAARGRTSDPKAVQDALDRSRGLANNGIRTTVSDKQPDYPFDDAYNMLLEAHAGLSLEQSHQLNTRLILLMLEQLGDKHNLIGLLARAQGGGAKYFD